jgi:hypothetical protein
MVEIMNHSSNDIKDTQSPSFLKWIIRNFDNYYFILDIGCGNKWYHPFLPKANIISIDSWRKANPDILLDLNKEDLPFNNDFFSVVFLFDVIEHLSKERGKEIIQQAKKVCKGTLVLLTPTVWDDNKKNITDPNSFYYLNENNLHKSLWALDDFDGWRRINLPCFGNNYFLGIYECQK